MKKVISTTLLLTALGFASLAPSAFAATTSTPVEHYNQAVASWGTVVGAKCYNIYYGWDGRMNKPTWNHAVRCVHNSNIPNSTSQLTIGGLKQGRSYEYTVAAVAFSGKESNWTPIKPLAPVSPQQ